ncbi:hypothetical protein HPY31_19495 [Brevibacillus sp. HB1.3]|uniref:hypothetical protein n=1 Tax=Brevibacillus sp. HB1.3 TaxID=2738842 RepID=UPI0015580689|nr:hypothetical protein [Brevibacillus sp. HB1.3]NQF16086.1 hypothetical protein [Brevibacillus sp. HB1.3]
MIKKGITLGLILSLASILSVPSQAINASNQPQAIAIPPVKNNVSPNITTDKVKQWIKEQSKNKATSQNELYLDFLYYKTLNLDDDKEMELVVTAPGGAHTGSFFVFDQQNEQYQLIFEEEWHVPKDGLVQPDELDDFIPYCTSNGKRLYKTIDYSGGTGIHVETAHLWYIENGKVVIAWEGEMKKVTSFQGILTVTLGTYHIENDTLHYFANSYKQDIEQKQIKKPDSQTEAKMFQFNGKIFEEKL